MPQLDDDLIAVGHIIGAHGVAGQVKVFSHTSPRENIVTYSPWVVEQAGVQKSIQVKGSRQGKHVIAKLEGITSRDLAAELTAAKILINSQQLPQLKDDDFYWAELIGLEVISAKGHSFGAIDHMLETGANDVMVVQGDRERLIPFVMNEIVKTVDLENQRVTVDWDEDF